MLSAQESGSLATSEINSLAVNESWLSVEVTPPLLRRATGSDQTSFE